MFDKNFIFEKLKQIYKFEELPADYSWTFDEWNIRPFIIKNFGIFGLVCQNSLDPLVKFIGNRKCYDVCAGVGYLSYCLSTKGIKCFAYDNYKTKFGTVTLEKKYKWFNVEKKDSLEMIQNIRDSVIIACWPDFNSNFMYNIAKNTHESNDLLFIGENHGGCNANEKFFDNFQLTKLDIFWYHYPMIHDHIYKVDL